MHGAVWLVADFASEPMDFCCIEWVMGFASGLNRVETEVRDISKWSPLIETGMNTQRWGGGLIFHAAGSVGNLRIKSQRFFQLERCLIGRTLLLFMGFPIEKVRTRVVRDGKFQSMAAGSTRKMGFKNSKAFSVGKVTNWMEITIISAFSNWKTSNEGGMR